MLAHEFLLFPEAQMNAILELQKEFSNMFSFRFSKSIPVPKLTDRQEKADTAAMWFLLESYKKNRSDCIQIDDEYILPVLDDLEEVDTFLNGCIPYRGLDYYGLTIIPSESIPQFERTIQNIQQYHEFAPLLALCEKVRALHCCILHFGI